MVKRKFLLLTVFFIFSNILSSNDGAANGCSSQLFVRSVKGEVHTVYIRAGNDQNTGADVKRALYKEMYKKNPAYYKSYGPELKDEDLPLFQILNYADSKHGIVDDLAFFNNWWKNAAVQLIDNKFREKVASLAQQNELKNNITDFMKRLASRAQTTVQKFDNEDLD